jgi:hypothetical protein
VEKNTGKAGLMRKPGAAAVLFIFLTGVVFSQNASDFELQPNDDDTVTILNYKGSGKDIVIPEKIINLPVTGISERAFSGKGLSSVKIPNSILYIKEHAFSNNNLSRLELPDALVCIEDYAFYRNQLTAVKLPLTAAYIGKYAFAENNLASIVIPDNVTVIGEKAFADNALRTIKLGAKVAYIGRHAFRYNRAPSITLPDSVAYLGFGAFGGGPRSITIGGNVFIDGKGGAYDDYHDEDGSNKFEDTEMGGEWVYPLRKLYHANNRRAGTYAYFNDYGK